MAVTSLATLKARLNKTSTADDVELTALLDAAEAEYAEHVRPLPGSQVIRVSGSPAILPEGATAVTAATYSDGTAVPLSSLDLDPATSILYGASQGMRVTVTFAPLPAHHVETIYADVAGLFTATQRGGGSTAPRFPGEGYAEPLGNNPNGLLPVVLFPRIRSLGRRSTVA